MEVEPRRRWSDELPPDVLREIVQRLHVAADFVRFHAVCRPWRDSRDSLTPKKHFLLPWLLAPAGKHHDPFNLRCIFSKSSYRVQSLPPQRTWVASADGDALGYLTVGIIRPRLHDPLTGAITDLPPFPPGGGNLGENPSGIVYGDGTTLLYTCVLINGRITRFRAALLPPGHNNWTLVDTSIQCTGGRRGEFCTAYHRGRIFFVAESYPWLVITADGGGCDTLLSWPPRTGGEHNYILKSHGELLWASVHTHSDHTLSVSVHALEDDASAAPEKMRWIRKDGPSLAGRVFFLGSPNSFAVDASLLGGHGGCVYFVYHNGKTLMRSIQKFGVFRYNLIDGKIKFMERLPREWDNEKCTWLIPKQIVAPIRLESNDSKLETPKLKKQPQLTRIIQTIL